jgi:tripartite-type tricarboxylate transporter receptor subunit TctC
MKKAKTLLFLCVLTGLLAACGGQSRQSSNAPATSPNQSQEAIDWPAKSVQIIAGGAPGGDTDFNSRVLTEPLQRELGQSFVVVNVNGGGGSIASRQVYDAAPDGYTVLITHLSHGCSVAAGMIDVGYSDYEMVGIIGESAGDIMVVNKSSPWRSMADVIQAAKANPGKIKLAVNTGSTTYAIAAAFVTEANAEFNFVDGGAASDKAVALLGGHIDVTMLPYGTAKPYLESGDFIPLGVSTEKRNPKFPDIPTYIENGYNVVCPTRYCFMMPPKTPREIVDKFTKTVEKIIKEDKEYAKNIDTAFSQSPFFLPPTEALAFYESMMPLLREYITPVKK